MLLFYISFRAMKNRFFFARIIFTFVTNCTISNFFPIFNYLNDTFETGIIFSSDGINDVTK